MQCKQQVASCFCVLTALLSPYPTRPACRERRDETTGGVGALGWPSMQASSVPESKETHASLASKHVCQRNVHLPLRALFLLLLCTLSPPSNARPRPTACTLLLPRARNKQGVSAAFSVLVLIISFISILLPLLCSRTCW